MIEKSIENGIVIARLANPGTNSITTKTLEQLNGIVDEVNDTEALKGIVLTGTGRFFSSGFDLPTFLNFKDHGEVVDYFVLEEETLLKFFTCRKPTVAAINGHAAAAGFFYAVACDYRIAKNHPKIRFGMSEIKIGLPLPIAPCGVLRYGLDREKYLRDIMYFAEMFDVQQAKAYGAVDETTEGDPVPRAKEIVAQWIDTVNRPFISMKQLMKREAAREIRANLARPEWKDTLHAFFREDVRAALEFVQASMDGKV
jgi:enoyl-CoA hydratase/carnithine racemase